MESRREIPTLPTPDDVLGFWLGPPPSDETELKALMRRWFSGGPEADEDVARRFAAATAAAARGELDDWRCEPRSRLALILLLDQFPRSIHRSDPAAFAQDARAVELTLSGMTAGMDRDLSPLERLFFYMPLQHAESAETQQKSVETFEQLASGEHEPFLGKALAGTADYARQHRDIIARFGRFPHRNAILERRSTPEEQRYLDGGAPTFGQRSAE